MPQNNPGRERLGSGETVFIDPSSLSEIPHHLTHQDIEALVGLNIPSSDLEELQDAPESHTGDASGVLISDGVSVANMVEVTSKEPTMEVHDAVQSAQPMEVDSLSDASHVLGDIDLLQQTQDLIPIGKEELIRGEDPVEESHPHPPPVVMSNSSPTNTTDGAGKQPLQTQILKTSAGHFVILQPNQGNSTIGSLTPGRIFSTSNQISTSNSTPLNNLSTKSVFVNANQIAPGLKQGVTKVIINNQPGNNLGQQLRLISSQSSMNAAQESTNQNNNNNNSPPKVALQLQPFSLSLPNSKNVIQSNSKTSQDIKTGTKLKMPVSFSVRSSSNPSFISNVNQNETVELLSQPGFASTATPPAKVVASTPLSPQKIFIKGNIPLTSVQSSMTLKPGQILATTGVRFPISSAQTPQQPQPAQIQQQPQPPQQQQSIQIPNKMSYIRLVNPSSVAPNALGTTITTSNQAVVTKASNVTKPIAPATEHNVKIKGLSIPANQTNSKQRLIIPISASNSQSITSNLGNLQIRPQGSITLPASALPPGVLSNAQPGSLVMIPAHYFQNNTNTGNPTVIQVANNTPPVSLPNAVTTKPSVPPPPRTVIDANGIKPRKPCNCTKSQCLKLYCDCFANGEFCNNCNCANCYNNLTHEEERQKAIRSCLERNPQAFRPKIGKGGTESERRHNKGCNCKRSGCLKNYCECYEAKIPCSSICKCIGCRNIDSCQPPESKKFFHLVEQTEPKVNQKALVKSRPVMLSSLPSPVKMSLSSSGKSPYCRINQEVVEATCQCLLAQAEKAEKSKTSEDTSLMVINEFSRCLLQIIGCNTKNGSRND